MDTMLLGTRRFIVKALVWGVACITLALLEQAVVVRFLLSTTRTSFASTNATTLLVAAESLNTTTPDDNDDDDPIRRRGRLPSIMRTSRLLRLDWGAPNFQLTTPLAQQMKVHQHNCSLPLGLLKMRNRFGLGSDLHMWTQALCNAMSLGIRVHTQLPWIYWDDTACRGRSNNSMMNHPTASALSCYFPGAEAQCPNDRTELSADKTSSKSTIKKLYTGIGWVDRKSTESQLFRQRHNLKYPDLRVGGIEYLFSLLNPIVVQEAERQVAHVFGNRGLPPSEQLITVHIRWGDKGSEMELRPIEEYVTAVLTLVSSKNIAGSDVHIFLASEDPLAIKAFQEAATPQQWNMYVDYYLYEFESMRNPDCNGNSKMSVQLHGRPGFVALASLLVALQANDYVLTSRSNWSRLINELRQSIVHPRCNNCTRMIDLSPIPLAW